MTKLIAVTDAVYERLKSIKGSRSFSTEIEELMKRATVVVDRQRRIYLPKRFKEKAGNKFFIVKIGDEIRLVPIPANPVEDLAKLGRKLPAKSIRQFKKEISAEAKMVS